MSRRWGAKHFFSAAFREGCVGKEEWVCLCSERICGCVQASERYPSRLPLTTESESRVRNVGNALIPGTPHHRAVFEWAATEMVRVGRLTRAARPDSEPRLGAGEMKKSVGMQSEGNRRAGAEAD